jgi:PAS domain S-box-containing protein
MEEPKRETVFPPSSHRTANGVTGRSSRQTGKRGSPGRFLERKEFAVSALIQEAPCRKVLLVDDDPDDRLLFGQALRQAGYDVLEAASGAEALLLARDRPDLVILDVRLPDLDGFAVCEQIKADPLSRSVPVVHLSGLAASDQNKSLSVERGAEGFVVKTADPGGLTTQVKALLQACEAVRGQRASEALLQDILDNAPVIVHLKDTESRYLLVNRMWEEKFRIPREDVLGKTVFGVHASQTAARLRANDLQVLHKRGALKFEEEVEYGGQRHTYLSAKFPLFDAEGVAYAVCGISTDITDRKKADRALRDERALYHSLVDHLPVSLYRKDLQGQFTFANREFCEGVGLALARILGKHDANLYPEELARKYEADDRAVMQVGAIFEEVEEKPGADGTLRYVEVLKTPIRDGENRVVGMQGILRDVTDRHLNREALRQAALEFQFAREIQQRLFPTKLPQVVGIDINTTTYPVDVGGASYPAQAIGGDYYDYLSLPDGSLGVTVGDVAGHGVGPALLMAETRAYLRAFAESHANPGQILALVNRKLVQDIEEDLYVTLVLARVDFRENTLVYASAGHPSGFILGGNGTVKATLSSLSVPLGLFEDAEFPCSEPIRLEPGDLTLFVTDGVTEARNPENQDFGQEAALNLARVYRYLPAREIVENIYHGVRAFCRNERQIDDITATVIKIGD